MVLQLNEQGGSPFRSGIKNNLEIKVQRTNNRWFSLLFSLYSLLSTLYSDSKSKGNNEGTNNSFILDNLYIFDRVRSTEYGVTYGVSKLKESSKDLFFFIESMDKQTFIIDWTLDRQSPTVNRHGFNNCVPFETLLSS